MIGVLQYILYQPEYRGRVDVSHVIETQKKVPAALPIYTRVLVSVLQGHLRRNSSEDLRSVGVVGIMEAYSVEEILEIGCLDQNIWHPA